MIPLRDDNPTQRAPVVTWALIGANVLAYLWEITAGDASRTIYDWGLVPARFVLAPWEQGSTLLTSMFLHAPHDWWHLGGNMLFLWVFGDNVEDALGRGRFLAFYLLSGLIAAFTQILVGPGSVVPMVGASGAIAGVLAAYGSLYPRAPVTVLNPVPLLWLVFGLVFRLPAWIVIGIFFVFNLISGLGSLAVQTASGGGVAFFAHLGGFVAGLWLVRILLRSKPREPDPWEGWRPPPRLRPEAEEQWPVHPSHRYPRQVRRWR